VFCVSVFLDASGRGERTPILSGRTVIAVALREEIRFDLDLLLRFEFGTGAGGDGSFDDGRGDLLIRLLVVVESAVVVATTDAAAAATTTTGATSASASTAGAATAEEVVTGRIGSGKRHGWVRISTGREGDAEFGRSSRPTVRGHVTGTVAGWIGEMLLLDGGLLVLEGRRKLRRRQPR